MSKVSSNSSEIFERLDRAYQRGFKGKVDSFAVWLDRLGIDPRLFNFGNAVRLLHENPDSTIDREEELASIVEFIGFYRKERNALFHLPILGVPGIGKTHLLNVLVAYLQKKLTDLPWNLADAKSFTLVEEDSETEPQKFLAFLDELRDNKYQILIIDSCDKDANIDEAMRNISRHFTKGVLVSAWTQYHWDFFREKVEEAFPTSKQVVVGPFSQAETEHFLVVFLKLVSHDRFTLKKELAKQVHEYSGGVPANILKLTFKAFSEAFNKRKKGVDSEAIKAAARALALDKAKERLARLSDHQLLILKHLLLETDERGIRPSKLVDLLGKDKATISYHLGELAKEDWLTSQRIGRWVFYKVRDELAPLVGARLAEEADFLG